MCINIREIERENPKIQQQLQYLIGSRYVPTVKAYISELTNREWVVGPNDFVTMMNDISRIKIKTNFLGKITKFVFG